MLRAMNATSGLSREELRRLRALARPSDARGLAQLALHLGALAVTSAAVLAARGGPWLLPALLLQGVPLVFLFAPLHETIHRTAFRSRALNATVATACGFLLLLPPRWFRAYHLAHHRHTQDPERDPELATPKPRTRRAWLLHVSGLPYWYAAAAGLLRSAAGRPEGSVVPPRERPAVVAEARLFLLGYALIGLGSLATGSAAALLLWVLPALLGQPLLRLYLLAEHTGCPQVPDMLRNSRTTLTGPLLRGLAWNMPYHVEHHAFPAIPFHALPQAHAVLGARIAVLAPGYPAVTAEIWRGLERSAQR